MDHQTKVQTVNRLCTRATLLGVANATSSQQLSRNEQMLAQMLPAWPTPHHSGCTIVRRNKPMVFHGEPY